MKNRIFYTLLALVAMASFSSCSDDSIVDNPSGETVIYWLRVANAGLTGTDVVEGVIDEANKTITFDVPAETNIEQIKFRSKLSLNAKLDQDVYDFSNLTAPVTVVNVDNRSAYNVTLNLVATDDKPLVESVLVKLPDGTQHNGYVSMVDSTIYLGAEGFEQVEIAEMVTLPHRANRTWHNIENNIVRHDAKGSVTLDFMGKTKLFRFSFSAIPVFGADFSKSTVWNFAADGGDQWPDFAAENTRSADFDGREMLIVSREGGINPRILTVDEIKSGSPAGRVINTDGVADGTFLLSAGRLSHRHIYITNLSTSISADQPFHIYHWANSNAACERVFTLDGTGGTDADETFKGKRFGDNISVNLDDDGNGYIFLVTQDGTMIMRLTVTNFTEISEPTYVTPPTTAAYYAYINAVEGSPGEYTFTSTGAPIFLMDKDGNQIGSALTEDYVPTRCTDARVIMYDNERYLITTSGRWGAWTGDTPATVYVYNLADGINTAQAFDKFMALEDHAPVFDLELGGAFGSAPAANTGWGVVNGNLAIMGAATKAGFIYVEFPERE